MTPPIIDQTFLFTVTIKGTNQKRPNHTHELGIRSNLGNPDKIASVWYVSYSVKRVKD